MSDICNRVFCRADILNRHRLLHAPKSPRPTAIVNSRIGLTAVACDACRRSKTKCDGQPTCSKCAHQSRQCRYSASRRFQVSTSKETRDVTQIGSCASRGQKKSMLFDLFETALLDGRSSSVVKEMPLSGIDDMSTHLGQDQNTLVAALLSHHVALLRFHAPLENFHRIPVDNSKAREIDDGLIDIAQSWATDSVATLAIAHSCAIYTITHRAAAGAHLWTAPLTRLAHAALYDSALALWIYVGMHSSASQHIQAEKAEDLPCLLRSQAEGGSLPLCQENAYEALMDLALLCKRVNNDVSNVTSKSIWSMAVNPFAELVNLRNGGGRPVGLR
ncbi:uncharacterized protein PV07_11178 [Cladophialophora immunda]|uniref:Zn(2)-C6 fungal-type domain-containing protein n=1 Tax=Cladophialophora immunda TaxID=569365 RepID=A0A0D2CH68_9EURO|nr:uncharacterized protein PV07_11178 [Cladophialophora immunda]KIW22934.1 hypothetical protein PV07_11178 [Cladophialophora immunda]